MRFAAKPGRYDNPGSCAVHPGRFTDERGGVDLGPIADGPSGPVSVWISYEGFRTIMRQVPQMGLAEQSELEELRAKNAALSSGLHAALEAAEALQGKLDRIAGLRKDGFTVAKVQGRPPKKEGATA